MATHMEQGRRHGLTAGQVAGLFNGASQPRRLDLILMPEQGDKNVGG